MNPTAQGIHEFDWLRAMHVQLGEHALRMQLEELQLLKLRQYAKRYDLPVKGGTSALIHRIVAHTRGLSGVGSVA